MKLFKKSTIKNNIFFAFQKIFNFKILLQKLLIWIFYYFLGKFHRYYLYVTFSGISQGSTQKKGHVYYYVRVRLASENQMQDIILFLKFMNKFVYTNINVQGLKQLVIDFAVEMNGQLIY